MIEAIYNVGSYALNEKRVSLDNPEHVTRILCEDPKSSDLYKTIITVEFNKNGTNVSFLRVGTENYESTKILRYLYRGVKGNSADLSPTCRLTKPNKTFNVKILRWFKTDFSDPYYGLTEEEQNLFTNIDVCIQSNSKQILESIIAKYTALKTAKERGILTIVLYDNGEKKYPGDFSAFKKILRAKGLSNYFEKYNKTSKSENKTCAICRKKRTEVYGFVSTYKFYTVDKPGMVSGGFNQSKAWKNYPVCRNCALTLEEGKKFLEKNSKFKFYDFDYLLIPKPLNLDVNREIYEKLKDYHREGTKVQLNKDYKKLLGATKREILFYLSDKPNTFHCNILIYAASNNAFKILRYIEGIFPNRLLELFDAKKIVDQNPVLKSYKVKVYKNRKPVGEKPLEFNFGSFWYFFGKRDDEDKSSYFLDIVSKVFQNEKVNYRFFLNGVVNRMRKQFAKSYTSKNALKESYYTKEAGMRGLCSLLYLKQLDILSDYDHGDIMNENKIREIVNNPQHENSTQKLEAIFDIFSDFFNRNSKRAVFIVGALAQLLLDIQQVERGGTPFRTKLQGLRLDQTKVKNLYREIQNKLEEYTKNYYRALEKLAAEYLIQAGNDWGLSKDEVSFYFVLGMNLASYLKQSKEVKNDE